MHPLIFCRFVHLEIPFTARTEATRFRWWQPAHSGKETDQWALDQILIAQYHGLQGLHDDFQVLCSTLEQIVFDEGAL